MESLGESVIHYSYLPIDTISASDAENSIKYMEVCRANSKDFNPDFADSRLNYYVAQFVKGNLFCYAAFCNGRPVTFAYLSQVDNYLMIDQIFSSVESKNNKLDYEIRMYKYIIDHLDEIAAVRNTEFDGIYVSPVDANNKELVSKLGFNKDDGFYGYYVYDGQGKNVNLNNSIKLEKAYKL